jgi:hypothetical protein
MVMWCGHTVVRKKEMEETETKNLGKRERERTREAMWKGIDRSRQPMKEKYSKRKREHNVGGEMALACILL